MFRKCQRCFYLVFILALFFISAAGCSSSDSRSENSETVYTIADSTGDWGFPAPYSHYLRGPGYIRMSFIFDTLLWKDENGLKGLLAEDWEYLQEENAYLFNLRKGVKWHDGEEFSASDVVFTFQYVQKHPYLWSDTTVVEDVRAVDSHQVKIYLKKAFAPFLANVAGTLPILPEHIYGKVTEPENFLEQEALIGTGPFKLADYSKEHGTYLYEANPDYYLGKPRVDKLRFIKVSSEMIPAAILDGSVSAGEIPPEVAEKFTANGLTVIKSQHDWNAKLFFNHQEGALADKKLRQALALAIDRDKLVEISQRGYALKGSLGMIPSDSEWYSPQAERFSFDPQKAQQLLEELGYQGLQLELLTKAQFARVAELIKADLEKVGISVELQSLEDKTVDSKILNWDFQLAISGHGGLGGDPEFLNKFIVGKNFNSARYFANEKLQDLLAEQLFIVDSEERKEMIAEIQKIYADELPTLTLYYPDREWAHDGKIALYYSPGGIATGIPVPLNKLAFIKF